MTDPKDPVDQPEDQLNQNQMSEAEIDQTLADTFPASDPPSWTLGTDHSPTPAAEKPESDDQDGE